MIHAVLLAALAAGPAQYDRAFGERDLHALVLLLSEHPESEAESEAQALYGDVVRLAQCEPLPPLAAQELRAPTARSLLRLEAQRRARLGAGAARSQTLWRDLLDPTFFRRTSALAAQGPLLRWPLEDERWSDEATDVGVRPWSCGSPVAAGDELAQLGAAELAKLQRALPAEAGARLGYHRSVRLLSRGERELALQAAQTVAPASLHAELAAWAQLMRLELGLDPAERYLALVDAPALAPVRLLVHERAAATLAAGGKWLPLLRLAAQGGDEPAFAGSPEDAAQLREDLLLRRALAYEALGNREALRSLLQRALITEAPKPAPSSAAGSSASAPASPALEGLRGLALEALARSSLDADDLALLAALGPTSARLQRLVTLGGRALAVGNARGAEEVAAELLRQKDALAQARGFALQAELSLQQEDRPRLERSVTALLALRAAPGVSPRQQAEVDAVAMQVAQALVLASARLTGPGWQPVLGARLKTLEEGVHSRNARSFIPLYAALADRPAEPGAKGRRAPAYVSVGEVAVGAPREAVAPPAVTVPWPEPYSLLSLPRPDGTPGDGFSPPTPAGAAGSPPVATPAAGAGTEVTHAP
ncbi:hypothetical protein FGE12_06770 [Aggregicoccus sp. 17bor-14]|uniref:hypothetical protein n=1 Tax=Myxococcaceae TaxID=31 RepID=UPI00129D2185|nr:MULTISPECIES: hypothetical protein [Myxococcaceae]MBF5042091.1 hypothetical protein [Simulacricoccus sp. 17bor-14]MRI87869.1 hypothetical protein [Aggregicoccus sp. 17bor-14]